MERSVSVPVCVAGARRDNPARPARNQEGMTVPSLPVSVVGNGA
ncbi:hypothetical protein [Desulfotomaculum copahuensis]|nr:hypothetical protein [Desulfotomaculum copahuensis]